MKLAKHVQCKVPHPKRAREPQNETPHRLTSLTSGCELRNFSAGRIGDGWKGKGWRLSIPPRSCRNRLDFLAREQGYIFSNSLEQKQPANYPDVHFLKNTYSYVCYLTAVCKQQPPIRSCLGCFEENLVVRPWKVRYAQDLDPKHIMISFYTISLLRKPPLPGRNPITFAIRRNPSLIP